MKKRRWAIIAFAVIFAAAYAAMGYCIPAFRIKLEADWLDVFSRQPAGARAGEADLFHRSGAHRGAGRVQQQNVPAIKKRACKTSPLFYVINFLQILAELIGGGQILFAKVVRRIAAADV